jgi:hypothetical protein
MFREEKMSLFSKPMLGKIGKAMMSSFESYVKGKKVAVVGPAGYMQNLIQGNFIDSHDIVVRLNSAVPVPEAMKDNIGTKTNVLSNCLHPSYESGGKIVPKLWRECGVEWLLSPYPKSLSYVKKNFESFMAKNNGLLKVADTPASLFKSIESEVKTRPNSGVLTVMYLLSLDIYELYVTGFSFAKDGYYPGYKSSISADLYRKLANSNIHQQEPQLEYTRKVFRSNSKFKADSVLRKLLMGER